MKYYSQSQKIISILVIFSLLLELIGCKTSKIIQSSSLPLKDSKVYDYVIHSQNLKYYLKNTSIADGYLTASIDLERTSNGEKSIHLYVHSDSLIKVNYDNSIRLSINNITKVKITETSLGLTMGCVALCLLVTGYFIYLVNSFSSW
jgi:hypothetical protein